MKWEWKCCDLMEMEYVIIDSSILIKTSLFWECYIKGKKIIIKEWKFAECEALFELIKKYKESLICVITKTIEDEAIHALEEKAVDNRLRIDDWRTRTLKGKYDYVTLKSVILDRSLDRMENLIEEYSTRFPLDKAEVNKILNEEIEPFFKRILPQTIRYKSLPEIIKKMRGSVEGKKEIIEIIKDSISSDKILYLTGEPKVKDKRIMAEATYICRIKNKDKIYLSSMDHHFIPNPTQIESYLSNLSIRDSNKMDTGMRDLIFKEFGFFSDTPKELLKIFDGMGFK